MRIWFRLGTVLLLAMVAFVPAASASKGTVCIVNDSEFPLIPVLMGSPPLTINSHNGPMNLLQTPQPELAAGERICYDQTTAINYWRTRGRNINLVRGIGVGFGLMTPGANWLMEPIHACEQIVRLGFDGEFVLGGTSQDTRNCSVSGQSDRDSRRGRSNRREDDDYDVFD